MLEYADRMVEARRIWTRVRVDLVAWHHALVAELLTMTQVLCKFETTGRHRNWLSTVLLLFAHFLADPSASAASPAEERAVLGFETVTNHVDGSQLAKDQNEADD